MKKALWTALVTGLAAAATGLAVRVAAAAWRKVVREEPPAMPRWARLLIGVPIKKGVFAQLKAAPL